LYLSTFYQGLSPKNTIKWAFW